MQGFFQMMLPGSIPIDAHRYVVDVAKFGMHSFDAVKVLTALQYLRAERWSLEPAAFLIHGWECDSAQGNDIHLIFGADRADDLRRFVRYFDGIPYDEMMTMFSPGRWLGLDAYIYRAGVRASGVPAEYIAECAASLSTRDWDAYTVANLHAQGIPARYISGFWRDRKGFDRLIERGVPVDMAFGCKDAGLSVDETIKMHEHGIPLEYALATKGGE